MKDCSAEPQAVGSRPDGNSPYGALDMSGNVAEFVSIAQSGQGVDYSKLGGSYLSDPSQEYTADLETGFRCARWQ